MITAQPRLVLLRPVGENQNVLSWKARVNPAQDEAFVLDFHLGLSNRHLV